MSTRQREVVIGIVVLISIPIFVSSCFKEKPTEIDTKKKPSLENITSYANTYQDYTNEDLEKLKRFDIVVIEPYYVPDKQFLSELKSSHTIILAYVSIGEADNERRYWVDWEPADNTPDNLDIPRTTVTEDDPMFIGEDPGWEGSYFIDASNQKWHNIMLNEEIPYILWLGGGQYDGLMMDVVDVVDEYEGYPNENEMWQGMIDYKGNKREIPESIVSSK